VHKKVNEYIYSSIPGVLYFFKEGIIEPGNVRT
jgi:hypothetical protein